MYDDGAASLDGDVAASQAFAAAPKKSKGGLFDDSVSASGLEETGGD